LKKRDRPKYYWYYECEPGGKEGTRIEMAGTASAGLVGRYEHLKNRPKSSESLYALFCGRGRGVID
jgi:hypothetical protein